MKKPMLHQLDKASSPYHVYQYETKYVIGQSGIKKG